MSSLPQAQSRQQTDSWLIFSCFSRALVLVILHVILGIIEARRKRTGAVWFFRLVPRPAGRVLVTKYAWVLRRGTGLFLRQLTRSSVSVWSRTSSRPSTCPCTSAMSVMCGRRVWLKGARFPPLPESESSQRISVSHRSTTMAILKSGRRGGEESSRSWWYSKGGRSHGVYSRRTY